MMVPVNAGAASSTGADQSAHPGVDEIRTLISMVSKTAMRDLDRRLEASGTGLSAPQYGVMRLLNQESATISELSSRMMLAPATLVPVVDTLERKGFVQRGVDPRDRRRIPLLLTEAGSEVVARVSFITGPDSLAQGLVVLGREKAQQLQALLLELINQFANEDALLDRVFALTLSEQVKAVA